VSVLSRGGWFHVTGVLLLLAIAGPLYLRAIRPEHNWGGDFSVYVSQARNLAEGHPLYESSYVVTPQSVRNHPASYPPIPALIVEPVYSARGFDYRAMKLALGLFAWLSLPLWYTVGLRLGLPPPASVVAVLCFGLGSLVYYILDNVGSDGVFLFWSAAALLALLALEQSGRIKRNPFVSAVCATALLLACFAVRSAGLALIAAAGLHELSELWRTRRLRPFALWLGVGLAVGLLVYQRFVYDSAGHYGSQFTFDVGLIARGAVFYLRSAAALWSSAPTPLRYLLAGSALGLAVLALVRRRWGVAEWYAVVFFAMLCLYTVNNDFRYMLPMLPVVLFLAAGQALELGARWMPKHPMAPAAALGVLALAGTALNAMAIDTAPILEGVAEPTFQETVSFLKDTPADTLVLSWNPRVFALYTRHPSALYPQKAGDFVNQIPAAQHVLLVRYGRPLDEEKLGPYIATASPTVVYSNDDFTVYRIK
jgi:hypothetical protein